MERKTKNIITISIIAVLIVGIILTIHFASSNKSRNIPNNDNMPSFANNNDSTTDSTKGNFPSRRNNSSDSTTDNESNSKRELPSGFDKDNIPSNINPSNNSQFSSFDMKDFSNRGNGMETKYVIFLGIESFLLGGAVMYLIINNINVLEVVNDKETKKK